MMYQKKSGKSAWLRYALALPFFLALTLVFTAYQSEKSATDPSKEPFEKSKISSNNPTLLTTETLNAFPPKQDTFPKNGFQFENTVNFKGQDFQFDQYKYLIVIDNQAYFNLDVEDINKLFLKELVHSVSVSFEEEKVQKYNIPGRNALIEIFTNTNQENRNSINQNGVSNQINSNANDQNKSDNRQKDKLDDVVFSVVQEMPMFGGALSKEESDKKLLHYLKENIIYPEHATQDNFEGKVYARFVIRKDGLVENLKVIRSPDKVFTKEVERVIYKMNTLEYSWTPGKQRNQYVNVEYTVPLTFSKKANPLYVIDNIIQPYGHDLKSELDPSSISKIEVLKGQRALEKYGEDGENGVVEITTKSYAVQNSQKERTQQDTIVTFDPDTYEEKITVVPSKNRNEQQFQNSNSQVDTLVIFDPDTFEEHWKIRDNKNDMSFESFINTSGEIEVTFESSKAGKVAFQIFDSMGRLLQKKTIDHIPQKSVLAIPIEGQTSGILIVACEQNGIRLTNRISSANR